MSDEKALEPVEQKEVDFYGDDITAVRASDGRVYASLRHMCDALGLNAQSQTRRIQRHTILDDGFMVAKMATIKGDRPANWLRVDLVPLWLSGVSTKSVKEEIRPKMERFQREAATVLWEAFREGRLTADPSFEELLQQDTDAVQAYKTALAVVKLARNQILLEARVDKQDRLLQDYGRRLETIEADLYHEERYITENQATQISQAIRAIAREESKRSGQNEYGRCWGEFYRKFGVSKYRHLPAVKFEQAMIWLNEWYQDLTGDSPF